MFTKVPRRASAAASRVATVRVAKVVAVAIEGVVTVAAAGIVAVTVPGTPVIDRSRMRRANRVRVPAHRASRVSADALAVARVRPNSA